MKPTEFFVVTHNDKPLKFGSYSTAKYVSSPFLASIYSSLPMAQKRVAHSDYYLVPSEDSVPGRIAQKLLKVKKDDVRIKRVCAEVLWCAELKE